MKIAEVKKLDCKAPIPELKEVSSLLDKQDEWLQIDTINWEGFNYKPEVRVALAYSDSEIFLKYNINENYFKAEKTETNQMVCEDSCVEFFLSPEEDGIYYNLEFNGIGTCLMGSGTGRHNNNRTDPKIVSGIRRETSFGKEPSAEREGQFEWTITLAVPFSVFFHHEIKELKGKTIRANFYKCGDMLSVPHYLTWNPVGTEKPDYHQPVYFGKLKFI